MALADMRHGTSELSIFNSFSMGFTFGILMVAGLFMLNNNTVIEYRSQYKHKKWKIYSN